MTENHAMVVRRDAAQATLDQFKDQPLRLGLNDCVRMMAAHLRRFKYKVKLPPKGAYRTERTGLKLLKAQGFDTVAEAIDALGLARIPPAAAAIGDIVQMPGEGVIGAFGVVLGNGRVLIFHQDTGTAVVAQAIEIDTAWRVVPQ